MGAFEKLSIDERRSRREFACGRNKYSHRQRFFKTYVILCETNRPPPVICYNISSSLTLTASVLIGSIYAQDFKTVYDGVEYAEVTRDIGGQPVADESFAA